MAYDEKFYERMMRERYDDSTIKVISIDEKAATGQGENFLSDMLRVGVKFVRNSNDSEIAEARSFILKHEPMGDSDTLAVVRDQQLFTIELKILGDILPRIESALGVRIGPKLVHGTDEPPRAIVMEDLTPDGFRLKDRQHGISLAHATLAIKNLAAFHAGSVYLWEENPELLKSFKNGVFNSSTHPNMFRLAKNSLDRLSEDAANWSDVEVRRAAKKLREIAPLLSDEVPKVYDYDEDEFCVLNHGDTWINNMLFTEDDLGNPIEQVYVDYQMSVFSSPAVDLLYFLSINPSIEVRGEGEESLLRIYSDELSSSMRQLGCKTGPPTMGELKRAMYKRRIYAVMSGLFLLPRMMLDNEQVEKFDVLLVNGTARYNAYENPITVRMMKRMLPLMSDRGYLDV